jgi:CRP/FNR family transcriptional regulator
MPTTAGPECALCAAKKTCFFHALDQKAMQAMRAARIANVYRKRQVIFYEGHRPHGVYVVCSGRVKVFKADQRGHQLTMRGAGPGDLLGYRALAAGEEYSATAEALEDATIAYLDEAAFHRLLREHDVLAAELLRHLARDVREAEDKARDLAMKSSRERLAGFLLLLKASHGKPGKGGTVLTLPFSRQDLAEMSGLAQETVIRLLGALEAEKILALNGRSLTLLDEGKLAKAALRPA